VLVPRAGQLGEPVEGEGDADGVVHPQAERHALGVAGARRVNVHVVRVSGTLGARGRGSAASG
jgi:hypothetical protein